MAAVDFSSAILKDGIPVNALVVGPYTVSAYKHWLVFEKDDASLWVTAEEDVRHLLPDARNVRTVPLVGAKDIIRQRQKALDWAVKPFAGFRLVSRKTGKETDVRRIFQKNPHHIPLPTSREIDVLIFKIADVLVVFFPCNPAWGGASYAYFLGDNGDLSVIATGYGHYCNPTLHWLNRDLSKSAENELMVGLWATMTNPDRFCELLVEQVFQNKLHHVDGNLCIGGFKKDSVSDPAILILYSCLEEKQLAYR